MSEWFAAFGGPALSTLGLLLDIFGVWLLARGVIISPPDAEELAGTHWDTNEPLKQRLLRQARDARVGVRIVVVGFVLQIAGTWVG